MATSKFQKGPDLKRFMVRKFDATYGLLVVNIEKMPNSQTFVLLISPTQDKRLKLLLNGNRKLVGILRGYDAFLNVVLEDAESDGGAYVGQVVIRGNSIVQFEALERVSS